MSLQVWLPLNGDLHNQGLNNVIIQGTAFTISNSGKTGQCIKTTANGSINTGFNGNWINQGDISFGGWFKFNQTEIASILNEKTYTSSATSATGNLIGNNSYGGISLQWNSNNIYSSGSFSSISVQSYLRTSTNGARATGSFTLSFDTWTHIFLTYDKTNNLLGLWINGELKYTYNQVAFTDARDYNLYINLASIAGGNGPSAYIPFYCNDIRIYNHCLSPKEIKKLSQELVLNYKLNINDKNNYFGWLKPNTEKTIIRSSSNTFVDYEYYTDLINSTETNYIVDFYAKGSVTGMVLDIYFRNSSSNAYACTTTQILTTNYKHYRLSLTGSPSELQIFRVRCYSGNAGDIVYLKNVRLLSNHIPYHNMTTFYDSSGYRHNGILNNNIETMLISPKYLLTNKFNSNTISLLPIFSDDINQCHTVSAWVYPLATGDSTLINFNSGYKLFHGSGGRTLMYLNSGTNDSYVYGTTLATNIWTFITWVLDTSNQTCKVYYNGVLNASSSNYTSTDIPSRVNKNLIIGSGFNGYISDIRIYATALSAEDILELYKNSKIINGTNRVPRDLD